MSKKSQQLKDALAQLDGMSREERSKALASKPPKFWGTEGLEKIGHKKKAALKAIRKKCIDCRDYLPEEVNACEKTLCFLWPFRMGTDPYRKGRGAEDA